MREAHAQAALLPTPTSADSPRMWARAAGVLYLIIVDFGASAQLGVRDQVVVAGDAAATAARITEHELLYRLGFAIEVFYLLCSVPLKYFLYRIFGVVNRGLGLVMILFAALGTAIQAVILLAHYAPLIVLGKGAHLQAFTTAQREAFALLSLQVFDYGYMIALAFFGCFCDAKPAAGSGSGNVTTGLACKTVVEPGKSLLLRAVGRDEPGGQLRRLGKPYEWPNWLEPQLADPLCQT